MKILMDEINGKIVVTTFDMETIEGTIYNSKTQVMGDLGNCLGPLETKRTIASMGSGEEAVRNHNAFIAKYGSSK